MQKLKKTRFLQTRFLDLIITQDLNEIKKVDITKYKTCVKFQQKILKSMVARARQNFQFFRQKTWFLGNNRGLP